MGERAAVDGGVRDSRTEEQAARRQVGYGRMTGDFRGVHRKFIWNKLCLLQKVDGARSHAGEDVRVGRHDEPLSACTDRHSLRDNPGEYSDSVLIFVEKINHCIGVYGKSCDKMLSLLTRSPCFAWGRSVSAATYVQDDGSRLSACINAASLALADAGIAMKVR